MPDTKCAFCGTGKEGLERKSTTRLILDGLGAGALAIGPDGHVCDANEGAARILRMPLAELCRARIDDVLAPLDRLRAPPSADGSAPIELSVKLPDGQIALLGCSLGEVEASGGRGWVVLFQEISAVVELRRQRDRLLQFAAIGESLPSVLHEIRNPLASVTSMLEVLVEEAEGSHQADLHALLWEIRRITLCLQGIGGMHTDLGSKTFEAVDVAIREACRIVGATAEQRGVRIRCEVPHMPLLPLRGAVMRGMVFNLMRNAIDACANDGDIHLQASVSASGRKLVLSVRDNGRGMTELEAQRCCDIFFTTKEHGSGVGLPICKQAVERVGGALRIESRPGAGTLVTVEVPIAAPA